MILGLDLSISASGCSVIDYNNNLIYYSTIKTKSTTSEPERFLTILRQIEELTFIYKPEVIVFEDIFNGPSVKTLISLARLSGMVIGFCLHNKIPYAVVHTMTMKKVILGDCKQPSKKSGLPKRNLKQEVKQEIIKRYDLDLKTNDNVTDSIAIGLTYLKEGEVLK